MKTLLMTLAFPLLFFGGPGASQEIAIYPAPCGDTTGLSAQINRLLSANDWAEGTVHISFALDALNRIEVQEVESENALLAASVKQYLNGKEVYPRINAMDEERYVLKIWFRTAGQKS